MNNTRFHEVVVQEPTQTTVLYRSTAKGGAECYLRLINGRSFKGAKVFSRELTTNRSVPLGILNKFVFARN